jgi:hypothetical protein
VALFRAKQFDRDDNEWQLSMASTENSALTEGDKAILRRFRDTLLAFMDDCISVLARERFSIETNDVKALVKERNRYAKVSSDSELREVSYSLPVPLLHGHERGRVRVRRACASRAVLS